MFLVFVSLSLFTSTYSYNYLIFCPLFGHSHATFFGKIADTLTDAGHNVTFFTPTIIDRFKSFNYTKSTKDVIHLEPDETLRQIGEILDSSDTARFWSIDSSVSEIFPMVEVFERMFTAQSEVLKQNMKLLDDLKARSYDVFIFESFVDCAYPLIEYLEIETYIPAVSLVFDPNLSKGIGEPVMASTVGLPLTKSGDRLGFMERAANLITPPIFEALMARNPPRSFKYPYQIIRPKDYHPHAPFVFVNSNPYLDFPRPLLAKTVEIGGISVDVEKLKAGKVDQYWDTVLDKRKHTVLVSFGSVIFSKDMPMSYKTAISTAMKNMREVTFIWKYEDDDTSFANNIPNIEFSKWVPQTALLADDRLTAFMTHAGLGSINEVSYLGKPSVICPLFADQMRNAKMLCRHNGSIEISKYDLSNSQLIQNALDTIINDKSYQLSAIKLSKQLNNQPIKPYELLIKHAEFAAQFGRLPSLDPYSRQMSFVQYFLIDVITTTIIIISIIVLIIYQIITKMVQLVSGTKSKKD